MPGTRYPYTKKVNVVEVIHGVEIQDPFRWLEDLDSTEVRKWIKEQNALTISLLNTLPWRKEIQEELMRIYQSKVILLPVICKERYFFFTRQGGQRHAVLNMSKGKFDPEKARIILDPNTFSEDGTVALDWYYPSLDGSYIAYGKSEKGSERSVLHILNVDSGEHLPETIPNTQWSTVAWLEDCSGFYYTWNSDNERYIPRVRFHELGSDPKEDPLIFGEGLPEGIWPSIYPSSDGRYLFLAVDEGWIRNDLYVEDLREDGEFIPIAVGKEGKFFADAIEGSLIIQTNYKAPRYRILKTYLDDPREENWREIIPEGEGVIKRFQIIGRKLVISLKENTYYRLLVYTLEGEFLYEIKLPSIGKVDFTGRWDKDEMFYMFSSFVYPPALFRYDLSDRKQEKIFQQDVKISPSEYDTKLIFYKSKDGTKVPMYIIHKKNVKLNGNNPTILSGYGGFALGREPAFLKSFIPWLSRGGVYAVACIRGGDEFGEEWHKTGMRDKKQNVFDDFIAAAEWLIENSYTNPSKLAVWGASNGGLLVGAVLTQRPDLFKAVVCKVPLLDMIRYHKFLVAGLWVSEYGSPEDPEEFKWLISYSPYHHVVEGRTYPAVFFRAAESDGRVHPMHAMKMAAKMQTYGKGGPFLLYVEPKAGHGAGKPLDMFVKGEADCLAFVVWQLNLPFLK